MSQESVTYQGVPWHFDDMSLPECGICHRNCLCPYIVEDGLFMDGKPVIVQICENCRDWLLDRRRDSGLSQILSISRMVRPYSAAGELMTPEHIDKLEDWQLNDRVHYYLMGGPPGAMPNYSADIAAAWRVVEKLRELSFNLSLFYSDEGFYCHFGKARLAGEADTAPLAICRAALKAVAAEQEKPVYGHYEGRYSWTQGQTHYPARIVQVQEPEQHKGEGK